MYSDENKSSVLAKFINGFDYVLIDTCSLMDDAFPQWMDALHGAKAYRKKELEILVPRRCYDELKKHARQKENDSRRIDAKRGLKILRRAKWQKLLTITKKDKNENFADNWIYVKVSTDRLFSKILIITQDKSLAYDLRALNQLKSQNGRPIEVCKFVTGGRLVPNFGEQNPRKEYRGNGPLVKDSPKTNPKGKASEANPAEAVLLSDARLSAVINNPNYPEEKKRADAIAQIKALEKLPESTRSRLNLLVPMARLQELAKPAKKEAPKPEPKKEEAKKPESEPAKERLWYGTGPTMAEGFKQCGEHYGLIFHDPSVLYFKDAHGPLDLTTKDLESIEALGMSLIKGEDKISFLYRGMTLLTQKCPGKYKCWIDVNLLPKALLPVSKTDKPKEAKPEDKALPAPAPESAPAEKPKATKAKKESKPKEEAPSEPKSKKTAAKKVKTAQNADENPKVEEPKEAEKPAKKASSKKAKQEGEPAEKKATPAKKPAAKKAEPKSEKAKAPAKKAAKPKAKPKQEAVEEALQKAVAADRRLQAVLPNPTYPLESKIADLKTQRELLASLPAEKIDSLKYGIAEIDEWLKANP